MDRQDRWRTRDYELLTVGMFQPPTVRRDPSDPLPGLHRMR
jgi:hypothetical protein